MSSQMVLTVHKDEAQLEAELEETSLLVANSPLGPIKQVASERNYDS
jgi:hypothetical protein